MQRMHGFPSLCHGEDATPRKCAGDRQVPLLTKEGSGEVTLRVRENSSPCSDADTSCFRCAGMSEQDRAECARTDEKEAGMKLRNAVALVTGGASGLGAATVRAFLEGGGRATILDRPNSPGEQLAQELGGNALFAAADVTNTDQVTAAIQKTLSKFGAIHIAVNCAGVGAAMKTTGKRGPMPLDIFEMVIRINLIGTFNVTRLAATEMLKNMPNDEGERGVIMNTAPIAAFDGQIGQVAYSASKGGVVGMTLPIARDLARDGIRCCTIAPGTFDTPMLAMLPQEVQDSLGKQVPFPSRLGKPEEYAALARHIIENVMLNGETIRLDGAIRLQPK